MQVVILYGVRIRKRIFKLTKGCKMHCIVNIKALIIISDKEGLILLSRTVRDITIEPYSLTIKGLKR